MGHPGLGGWLKREPVARAVSHPTSQNRDVGHPGVWGGLGERATARTVDVDWVG